MINIFFVLIILVIISILIYFFKKKILLVVQLFAKIFHIENIFLFKLLNKNLIISSKNLLIKKLNQKLQ